MRAKEKYEVSINLLKKCDEKSFNNILTLNKLDNRNNYSRLIEEEIEDKLSEDEGYLNDNDVGNIEKDIKINNIKRSYIVKMIYNLNKHLSFLFINLLI